MIDPVDGYAVGSFVQSPQLVVNSASSYPDLARRAPFLAPFGLHESPDSIGDSSQHVLVPLWSTAGAVLHLSDQTASPDVDTSSGVPAGEKADCRSLDLQRIPGV